MIFWGPPGVGKTTLARIIANRTHTNFVNFSAMRSHTFLSPPKSNALYLAYGQTKADALQNLAEPVPLVIRNAPTHLMKELDYGKGYQYAHDSDDKLTDMQCLPDSLAGHRYYRPTEEGDEKRLDNEWRPLLHGVKTIAAKERDWPRLVSGTRALAVHNSRHKGQGILPGCCAMKDSLSFIF